MRSIKFSCLLIVTVLSLVLYCQCVLAELPASVVNRLKLATVFIKVASKEGMSQGTGFFIEKNLVVTNAHVLGVKDQWQSYSGTLEVVLRSGMSGEQSINCTIAGVDSGRDLAFLKVPAQNGIEPIKVVSSAEVNETLPIYVLGYPLGDLLDRSGNNPALSFATGRVSSIRRDANEDLESIQVDASLVPGNSGGPIVDSKGELVGVAVSTVLGTNTGFSIPADAVKEDLKGKVCGLALTQVNNPNGSISVSVKARTVDRIVAWIIGGLRHGGCYRGAECNHAEQPLSASCNGGRVTRDRELILRGAEERLAPILMTALPAALALAPLGYSGSLPG